MDQLINIKEQITSVLKGGDILFIVPPFATREYSILGPHILQSIAREMGYTAEILYAGILFSSIIGEDLYDKISQPSFNLFRMKSGERLFSKSAYGLPLQGKFFELDANDAHYMTESRQEQVKALSESDDFSPERLLELEETCLSFVNEIVPVIAALDYKIIGCTSMLDQNNSSAALLNGIKKIQAPVITLMGGANCEGPLAQGVASLSDSIDYVFSGESEISFKKFLQDWSRGALPANRVITGEPLQDLDSVPAPDYESFFTQMEQFSKKEFSKKEFLVSYETSRGCWWGQKEKCYFCGLNDQENRMHFRQKSEAKVLEELEFIARTYPATGILMTDNIMPNSYFKNLLPSISEKKDFPLLWYETKSNLKLNDLIALRKARITSVLIGMESLSTGLLTIMNKRIKARHNILLLRNAHSVGINIQWYMLWGFPGDRAVYYEELLDLLPLMRHLQPPGEFIHILLERFSSYFENPGHHQILDLQPGDVYHTIYPPWANIDKLAYFFTGTYPCEGHENLELIREIEDEVDRWKSSWENCTLAMKSIMGTYVILDNRDIHEKSKKHIIEFDRAKEIMTAGVYKESENLKWAVAEKLGVVLDSWYIPLVTASPELLLLFEE
ncbi:MAG: RiPP maturation radical SAM protein 1 [bacterium]|nr:RiPP maturation radical SAM protein 1 [bacterium]